MPAEPRSDAVILQAVRCAGSAREMCWAIDGDGLPGFRARYDPDGSQVARGEAATNGSHGPSVDGEEGLPEKGPGVSPGPSTTCGNSDPTRPHLCAQAD